MPAFPTALLRCALPAVAGLLVASTLAGCGGDEPDVDESQLDYLALGDSVPFGFRLYAGAEYEDDVNFVGYPRLLAVESDLAMLNLSCPGESSASFSDVDAENFGCTNTPLADGGFRDSYPLHADYEGSQQDAALAALADSPDLDLITVQLGANDYARCVFTGACDTAEGLQAMTGEVQRNLDSVLSTLREEGGYDGLVVVVNYWATDYDGGTGQQQIEALNEAIATAAEAHDAVVADAYTAFRKAADGASTIEAGLVRPNDTHPSDEGQRLLADTVEKLL